jgi:hemerythrin-like domain-containing protein
MDGGSRKSTIRARAMGWGARWTIPPTGSRFAWMHPIDLLLAEHMRAGQMLELLEQSVAAADAGEPICRTDVQELARFFRVLVVSMHQARETELLIPLMRAHGVDDEALFAAVASEHEQEHALLLAVERAAAEQGDAELAKAAYAYADHAACHMYIEETMLFPAARAKLPRDTARELAGRFKAFDRAMQRITDHEALRSAAQQIAERVR